MRRASACLLGAARQAAAGSLQCGEALAWGAGSEAGCSRAAWLPLTAAQPGWLGAAAAAGSGAPAAAALQSAGVAAARGISSSSRAQHTAEPARAEAAQAAAQAAAPAQRQQARNCWQCGTRLSSGDLFFCPDCESVQPASADVQYFKVFDMDQPEFDLDVQQLERQYKQLQRQLHPDKFSTASSLEQEYAHQQSSVINNAYDVLKRPLRRAHYILNQQGFGACEGMTITDPELLMYVMEAREEVDSTQDPQRLQQVLDENQTLEKRCIQELVAAFGSGDLQHAAELTTQLRYICRIREAIVDKM